MNKRRRVRCANYRAVPHFLVDGPHSGPYIVKYLLLLCVFLSGCIADSKLPDVQTVSDGGEQTVGYPLTLTDALDRKVTFDTPPTRVISVAPKNTELVYALGLGSRLVGTTTFCNYPAAALDLPKIGGVTSQTIDQEKIVALNPDLILCSNSMHESLMSTWEELQIPVLVLGAESLEEMYHEMKMLARLLNRPESASKVISSLQNRVKNVTEKVSNIPADQRPKLFYQVWDEPLMGAGPSSFIGEILDLTGGAISCMMWKILTRMWLMKSWLHGIPMSFLHRPLTVRKSFLKKLPNNPVGKASRLLARNRFFFSTEIRSLDVVHEWWTH